MEKKTYKDEWEYFDTILNKHKDYVKPVVHYRSLGCHFKVGQRAMIKTVDHPAKYLNDAPWVNTSTVVEVDPDGKWFETLNTKYVLKED